MDTSNSKMREYAQQENEYVLSLLLRPTSTVEEPQALAERNCRATANSFGESDPLHAMALNTLAFVHVYRGSNLDVAQDAALKAAKILLGCEGQEEMLLESKCLTVLGKTKAGSAASSAVQAVFQLPRAHTDSSGAVQATSQSLAEILSASVFKRRLTRVVLQMALREITETLLKELMSKGDMEAHQNLLHHLLEFLNMYYGPAGDKNEG